MPPPLSRRVRQRLRDELTRRKISQRILAQRLSRNTGEEWSQSKVHKILTGQVQLLVDDMELIAAEAGLNLVEIIREPGRELVADLTPTEMRLIVSMREHPKFMHSMAETLRSIEEYAKAKPGRRTIRERMADDKDE
jgi:transcriptional regulator with XRE-family HTH domain